MPGVIVTARTPGRVEEDAWRRARGAASAAGVEVKPLTTLPEADLVTEVMIATWGEHQLLPRELLRAFQDSGNFPWGAFEGERIVGYVLGFRAQDPQGLHIHSHMLAVLPEWRSRGVGYALKMAQRAAALGAGLSLVRWTYDPLLSRNAHFNIVKLGATADRFERDFYGEMADAMNRGDRSDRLVVRWDLDREPAGPAPTVGHEVLGHEEPSDADSPRPTMVQPPQEAPALVRIPRDYASLRARDAKLADEWRDAVADAMEACFGAGLVVTGFTSNSAYVFA